MTLRRDLGPRGTWASRKTPPEDLHRWARATEELGWGAFWISGGADPGTLDRARRLLEATSTIRIGTSILNMWAVSPAAATAGFHELEREHPGRFLLGVGPSHAPLIASSGLGDYVSPLATSREYLAELATQPEPVPAERLLLSALGPKALQLAAAATAGSIPYLTVPAHTAAAREALGPDRVLAPELGVVLAGDRETGRARARQFVAHYLELPNYANTLLNFGFSADDFAGGGSDALIDTLFGIGSAADIAEAIEAHHEAGADHVAVQVLPLDGQDPAEILAAIEAASTA